MEPNILIRSLVPFIFIWMMSCSPGKQIISPFTPEEIIQAVNNDQWIFKAHYVMPAYGRSRDIRGYYEVRCSKDTLTVSLPYFGKMNSPGAVSNQNPLDFRSTDFSVKKEEQKSGHWDVTIKPNDFAEVQSMIFSVYDNGSSQLNIIMTSRSSISFTGTVEPKK
jgi:hypothetical protein